MNAVEIEQAISNLSEQPFNAANFPYAFLEAFGNKETTIKRLKSGGENKTDIENAVLQRNNIHIAISEMGKVNETLNQLRASPATTKAKAKFILATDGVDFEAEELSTGETVACAYPDFPNHFGFFLALAGISTVKQIRESAFDIRATSRLNRLYIELLKTNPDWGTPERRHDMNHFMARLIFCFFAEDTDIFNGTGLFTATIEQMSAKDASDTHWVISEIFRAMNTPIAYRNAPSPHPPDKGELGGQDSGTETVLQQAPPPDRGEVGRGVISHQPPTHLPFRPWADQFPYVNGGLFSGSIETPKFSKIARSYLLHVGNLDWTQINPDIFGSMIQAVADDEERGALGMHYTSVPNILKVLNPLFLDDLRAQLAEAGDNKTKLLNLRKRMAHIRVFDPACGSGNFLVIAYKQMREIEAEINQRRGEQHLKSEIPLTNFRGIEIRDFSAEIARLALIIAEYQCDVLYRGQKEALAEFLPLDSQNWITCENALKIDWLSVCPPSGTSVKLLGDDLFNTPLEQAEIDFKNEGGETYICGNPPYLGSRGQTDEQKDDLKIIFEHRCKNWKSLDYVAGWFMKATDYSNHTPTVAAFVSTNSICQGMQVPTLWPLIFKTGHEIAFAHTSFKWANLASYNAGVTVAIVAIAKNYWQPRKLYSLEEDGQSLQKEVTHINAYLVGSANVIVDKQPKPISQVSEMTFGNTPIDGGHLLLTRDEAQGLTLTKQQYSRFVRRIYGSAEFIRGIERHCLWIEDDHLNEALSIPVIYDRINNVRALRLQGGKTAKDIATRSHQFQRTNIGKHSTIIVPAVSSESRPYLPVGYLPAKNIVSNSAFALYDAPLWNLALIASRLHLIWIATVCGKLKTDFRYSNTLGWNTFPLPTLTEKNRQDLTRCTEDILLAREAHFPATTAELYAPDAMPENLRHAHERNDEVLERIYIGRRFKNDTERLEKLFELYTKMTAKNVKAS